MSTIDILIMRLAHGEELPLPSYQSAHAAGLDLLAAVPATAPLTIAPRERALVPTGLAIALPENHEGQVRPRSGLAARNGLTVLNAPGTIDADYRGEIQVLLINLGNEPVTITRGMRIAQLVIAPVVRAHISDVASLDETSRGSSGFGSSLAGDVRHTNLIQEPDAELFLYYRQLSPMRVTVAVRTRSDPSRLGNTVRQALSSVDKDLAVARIQTMEKILTDSISSRRLTMLLLSIFAAVALILAAVGIYGVISYSVAQRRHEIGIRMALGAPGERVLWMVTGQAMLLAGAGEVVGLAAAFALRRLIESQLYGSTVIDPAIFTAVPLILGAVALVAAIIPARRAMQVDPLIALRRE